MLQPGAVRGDDPPAHRVLAAAEAKASYANMSVTRQRGFSSANPAGPAAISVRRPLGSAAATKPAVLALENVSKSFGAVRAVTGASITLREGEVHALLGENGAGKSTVVSLLAGAQQPDTGRVLLDGQPVDLANPLTARMAGVAVMYQEPSLFPDLSIAENVFMGRQPLGAMRRIDTRALRAATTQLFERLGVTLDPARAVRGLSIADQQMIEIAKALSFDARVLIMDEPTAALSGPEVQRLFAVVRTLRDRGAAILFISHRLDEVFALATWTTIMRDGDVVHAGSLTDLTPQDVVRRMVGRDLNHAGAPRRPSAGEVALSVSRLTREGVFVDVSFDVRRGEIVALAGLVGAGRSEVARSIFGVDRYDAGEVLIGGRRLRKGSPAAAVAAGIAFVPENRREQGLAMSLSIERNTTLALVHRLTRFGMVSRRSERRIAREWGARLGLAYRRTSDQVDVLSGGNQQKVVLSKWLATGPGILIVDEPTRGIDIGTKAEIHALLSTLADDGLAVLMISSELPEILALGDRVLVMREGRLAASLSRGEASEESVMLIATGQLEDRTA